MIKHQTTRGPGRLIISLDFELAWGTRGRPTAKRVQAYLPGTRNAIRKLLAVFQQHRVPATWVAVGALALGGPTRHPWLSGPEFADIPVGDHRTEPHWYAEDIFEWLREAEPAQDIGCHTLTHLFVQDTPECREAFDLELARSVELFQQLGLPRPRSFIFPKHFMAHFDLLARHGFKCYRGPESGWFERLPGSVVRAGFRLLDAKLRRPPCVRHAVKTAEGLWEIPSSQYYSPFQSVGRWVSLEDRVAKARRGIQRAAATGGVYHLWTHPFNLGLRTDELIAGIVQILEYAQTFVQRGQLEFTSMAGYAAELEALSIPAGHASITPPRTPSPLAAKGV